MTQSPNPKSRREEVKFCRMLYVPMDDGYSVGIPFPMSEESLKLLLDTIELWKPRLLGVEFPDRYRGDKTTLTESPNTEERL